MQNNGGSKQFFAGQPNMEPPPAYYNGNPNGQYPQQQWQQPIQNQPQGYLPQYFPNQQYRGQAFEMQPMPFSAISTALPDQAFQEGISAVENELRQHSQLFLTSAGRIDEGMSLIQIQDANGRTIYNVQIQAISRLVSANAQSVQMAYGAVYSVCDNSGREVIRVQQETSSMHASMMGRSLGFVQNEDMCSTSFTACNTSGGSAFHIKGNDSCCLACSPCCTSPNFRIRANGEDIGGMETSSGNSGSGNSCAVSFPQQLDVNSKALLMTAGIMIYIEYFGKTGCGSTGSRGKSCTWCCVCCGINIFLIIVPIVVVLLIFIA